MISTSEENAINKYQLVSSIINRNKLCCHILSSLFNKFIKGLESGLILLPPNDETSPFKNFLSNDLKLAAKFLEASNHISIFDITKNDKKNRISWKNQELNWKDINPASLYLEINIDTFRRLEQEFLGLSDVTFLDYNYPIKEISKPK